MYKRLILLLIYSVCATALSYSQHTIKGMVCAADSIAIPYATVLLLSHDTISAECISTSDGFSLQNIPTGRYNLRVSYVGYHTKELHLEVKENINVGTLILDFGYDLSEISITASRHVFSRKKGIFKVNVGNTYLSSLPTLDYLLNSIPGLSFTDGKLKNFGRGKPLILINGKELKSQAQLNALQPSQIAEITVNNHPGARYDSRYSSVVNIKTSSEKAALLVYNTATLARHFSDVAGINSQFKVNKFLLDLSYGFRQRDNELYSIQQEESFQPKESFYTLFQDTTYSQRTSHDWSVRLHRKIKRSSLSLEYSGYYSINTPVYNSLMQTDKQASFLIYQTGTYKERQHALSLDYSLTLSKENTLKVTTDYLHQTTKDKSNTTETALTSREQKHTPTDFTGKYDILSFLTEYTHVFSEKVNLLAGARYSNVNNGNRSQQNLIPTDYDLRENRYAVYATGEAKWKKFSLQLGLRGEKFEQRYRYNNEQRTDYNHIFFLPSFSVIFSPVEILQLSFSCNKKISLPSFNELTPITTYLNQYSYSIGNPLLKPATAHNVEFGITLLDKLSLSMEYSQIKNDRLYLAEADVKDNRIIKYTYDNIDRSKRYNGMISYSDKIIKRHDITLSAGIFFSDTRIPYYDGFIHYTKPTYYIQFYSNWKIGSMLNFSAGYVYQSKSYDKADITTETHNLYCNLSLVPVKSKLFLSLQANDLLHKAGSNWQTSYGYFKTGQSNNYDNRNMALSIRYVFNSFKRVRKGMSNEEEINRL